MSHKFTALATEAFGVLLLFVFIYAIFFPLFGTCQTLAPNYTCKLLKVRKINKQISARCFCTLPQLGNGSTSICYNKSSCARYSQLSARRAHAASLTPKKNNPKATTLTRFETECISVMHLQHCTSPSARNAAASDFPDELLAEHHPAPSSGAAPGNHPALTKLPAELTSGEDERSELAPAPARDTGTGSDAQRTLDGSHAEKRHVPEPSRARTTAAAISSPSATMFSYAAQHGHTLPPFSITNPGHFVTHHAVIPNGPYDGVLSGAPRQNYTSASYPYAQAYSQAYQSGALYPLSPAHAGLMAAKAQVYLCNRALWLKFHRHQTEMIITKQGR